MGSGEDMDMAIGEEDMDREGRRVVTRCCLTKETQKSSKAEAK